MERKGITPVIAVVMLLMMTLAAVGGAYTWWSGILTGAKRKGAGAGEKKVVLDSINCSKSGNITFNILNDGKTSINAKSMFVEVREGEELKCRKNFDLRNEGFTEPQGSSLGLVLKACDSSKMSADQTYTVTVKFPNEQSLSASAMCTT